jgi:hypothetical protein
MTTDTSNAADGLVYEIVTISDPYTISAPEFSLAAAATLILGRGKLGLEDREGDTAMPLFIFDIPQEFLDAHFGGDLAEFVATNRIGIAESLDTVLIGTFALRRDYLAAMEAIDDPEKRKAFQDKWHDNHRTSMNDIGAAAWGLAARLREIQAHHDAEEEAKAINAADNMDLASQCFGAGLLARSADAAKKEGEP